MIYLAIHTVVLETTEEWPLFLQALPQRFKMCSTYSCLCFSWFLCSLGYFIWMQLGSESKRYYPA